MAAPGARDDRIVLWLHGGGYVIGSLATHRDLAARVSRAAASRVLLLDYRRAPEHPFPAALDDAIGAYRWLVSAGHVPGRLALGGDSAGGGLALASLVGLRDSGDPLPFLLWSSRGPSWTQDEPWRVWAGPVIGMPFAARGRLS